uniref:Uncharacterized protein n=1 Tax=Arundo donax TaxID=35708 RepID=A0A0A9FFK1_ARUDO
MTHPRLYRNFCEILNFTTIHLLELPFFV